MNSYGVSVDFGKIKGKIKPMNGTNCGPRQRGKNLSVDMTEQFCEMGITYSRLHDVEYPYGSNQFVDIHCIFPNFDADENDESSYNFAPTDSYINAIVNSGAKVFYRLGESIDHYPKKLYVNPPKSPEKWAKICEHIISHYNEGWANGFYLGIEYWEIWNEPDNDKMWTGTKEEFFELYGLTANRLKKRFGNKIKVGGCGFSGFYMLNRENPSEWFKTLVPYMHDFLKYITDEKTKAPLDFFSWHCYADSPEEIALHARFAENILNEYGFYDCESILDEFNMYYCFRSFTPFVKGSFADVAASLIIAQKSNMDMLMQYGIYINQTYNNFFGTAADGKTVIPYAAYGAMKAFDGIYRLENEVESTGDVAGALNVVAAANGKNAGIMLVSRELEGEIEIRLDNCKYGSYVITVYEESVGGKEKDITFPKTEIAGGKILIHMEKCRVAYISLN